MAKRWSLETIRVGDEAVVVSTPSWRKDRDGLTPEQDVLNAMKKLTALAAIRFETALGMNSVKQLKANALFEIRVNGVRFYGARLPMVHIAAGPRSLLVVAGAEQKSGNVRPDASLLARVEREIEEIRQSWGATGP
jgi:hypothetical protein